MEFEMRDVATLVGGTVSLASLYFALKRSDDKLSEKLAILNPITKEK